MIMNLIINVRVTGKGEQTLVLSHGYGGSQSIWDLVLPDLAQRYRVMLFDWNLSGADDDRSVDKATAGAVDTSKYSSFAAFADAVIALMDQLKLKGVVFVGHSMSGMIGCIASIKRPDLFSHLVLVAASPRYLNSDDYEGGFERAEVDSILSNIEFNFQAWADGFVKLAMGPVSPVALEKFAMSFKSMKPEFALALARTIFLGDRRDVLDKVEVPATIIQGTNDFAVPVAVGYYMQSRIKGKAALEVIDADGHFPQLTVPDKLLETLGRVLASKK